MTDTHGRDPHTAPIPAAPSQAALLARLATALVMAGTLGAAGWIALQWEPTLLPVRVVKVEGEMHGLSRASLQQTLEEEITGGILTQDLAHLRDAVEALPWIASASVKRIWPDRIEVRVREHTAIARWGENGLVTEDGIVFRPSDGRLPAGLVRLDAAADRHAPEVVERLRAWSPRLGELGLLVERIERDARGDWSVELLGGTEILLGTNDIDGRFARLIASYAQVEAIGIPQRIDLRYSNGLAVRWLPAGSSGGAPERVADNRTDPRS